MREPLQHWINANTPKEEMFWEAPARAQMLFVRDRLAPLVLSGMSYEEGKDVAQVIGTHTSKSITLPVYELERPDKKLRVILRDNFYDWKLSVIAHVPVKESFRGLFDESGGSYLSPVYFEGFDEALIFPAYAKSNGQQFSASIGTEHALWATAFLIVRALGLLPEM